MHSAFLECRIGHFERMVSRAQTGESYSVARPGDWTQEQLTAESGRPRVAAVAGA